MDIVFCEVKFVGTYFHKVCSRPIELKLAMWICGHERKNLVILGSKWSKVKVTKGYIILIQ